MHVCSLFSVKWGLQNFFLTLFLSLYENKSKCQFGGMNIGHVSWSVSEEEIMYCFVVAVF